MARGLLPPGALLPHDTTLIATIAAAFVLAFGFGLLASLVKLPPLVLTPAMPAQGV